MSQSIGPRKAYLTDLSDEQWGIIEPLLPPAKNERGGRPREVDLREVVNTILYLNRTGCQWDMLPNDLVPKSTAYEYFAHWRDDGTWTRVVDALRSQIRVSEGREPTPSAACIDSQSVKTTEVGGADRGYDGGTNIKGRKRHLLVDTLGLLIAVLITGANVDDGTAAPVLLDEIDPEAFPRRQTIFGDNQYNNKRLDAWLRAERPGWKVEVRMRPEGSAGFTPVRKRWVVERSNAWHGRNRTARCGCPGLRRNSKDYERRAESGRAMMQISHIHRMVRSLAPIERPAFTYRTAA